MGSFNHIQFLPILPIAKFTATVRILHKTKIEMKCRNSKIERKNFFVIADITVSYFNKFLKLIFKEMSERRRKRSRYYIYNFAHNSDGWILF